MTRQLLYFCATPAPYRNAEVDRVVRHLGKDALTVVFDSPVHDTASWGESFPESCPFRSIEGSARHNGLPLATLPTFMDEVNPAAVIIGNYRNPASRAALAWCRERSRPYCLRTDSNIWSERSDRWLNRLARRWLLGRCVRRAFQCLVTGSYNREFWLSYGMTDRQEGWWPQWIDGESFLRARVLRRESGVELRRRFGLESRVNVLFVGRVIPLKRIGILCEAMLRLDDGIGLVLAGTGEAEAELREKYGGRLRDRLRWMGNVPAAELPELYAACDVLALASGSREHWGMVINEAVVSGLPVICSRYVGAAGDLVENGVNGITLERSTPEAWAEAIQSVSSDPGQRARMGQESERIADRWVDRGKPEDCIRRLREAVGRHPGDSSFSRK